jgi:hypothetical protein
MRTRASVLLADLWIRLYDRDLWKSGRGLVEVWSSLSLVLDWRKAAAWGRQVREEAAEHMETATEGHGQAWRITYVNEVWQNFSGHGSRLMKDLDLVPA